jgi:hypothetical protein
MPLARPAMHFSDMRLAILPAPRKNSAIESSRGDVSTAINGKAKTTIDSAIATAPTPMLIALHPLVICFEPTPRRTSSIPPNSRDIESHIITRNRANPGNARANATNTRVIAPTTQPIAIVCPSRVVRISNMFKTGMRSDLIRLALLILIGPILIDLLF